MALNTLSMYYPGTTDGDLFTKGQCEWFHMYTQNLYTHMTIFFKKDRINFKWNYNYQSLLTTDKKVYALKLSAALYMQSYQYCFMARLYNFVDCNS